MRTRATKVKSKRCKKRKRETLDESLNELLDGWENDESQVIILDFSFIVCKYKFLISLGPQKSKGGARSSE